MDTKKTGMFLKQLRSEKGMTQEQLGEKIGVSNKTVSRWETGSYMPPIECLNLLSNIYHISINEIVAGERSTHEKFAEIAERNITSALKELEKGFQKFERQMTITMLITTILTIVIILLLPMEGIRDVIIVALVVAVAFIANTLNIVALAVKRDSLKEKERNGC